MVRNLYWLRCAKLVSGQNGLTDKASDLEDWGFESLCGRLFILNLARFLSGFFRATAQNRSNLARFLSGFFR